MHTKLSRETLQFHYKQLLSNALKTVHQKKNFKHINKVNTTHIRPLKTTNLKSAVATLKTTTKNF